MDTLEQIYKSILEDPALSNVQTVSRDRFEREEGK